MPRIIPLEHEEAAGEVRKALDEGIAKWGRMTNMKRTLLRSLPAYHALMQWYLLFNIVGAVNGVPGALRHVRHHLLGHLSRSQPPA